MTTAAMDHPLPAVEESGKGSLKWLIAITVALGALLEIVDTSIVNVALADMQASLGATLSEIGWVVTSYAIANVIILPLTAWLGDRFGKKRYFIFSLISFTLASILCGVSTTLPMLIVARVLQGLGGGGLLAKAQSILFETFPKKEQAMAQALFGAVVIAGPTIGPTLGGYIVTNWDWRWIFFINIPIGIAAVAMSATFLPPDTKKKLESSIDWFSIALLAAGIGSLQTVFEQGQEEDWFDSAYITALSVVAVVTLVIFVRRQLRSSAPVVDLKVLRYRSLAAGSVLSAIVGMGLYGALFAIPIFAQSILHFTSQKTGMLLLPGALTAAFMMPIAGQLTQRFDPRKVLAVGAVILIFAVYLLSFLSPQTSADDFFWPLVIRSIGTPLMFLPMTLATLGPIPKKDVPAATGFFNLTRQLGGSFGVAMLTTILARRQVFHEQMLTAHMSANDPSVIARIQTMAGAFVARGADVVTAKARALALIAGNIKAQAAVMSFSDTFFVTMVLLVGTLPLILMLEKPAAGVKVDAGH